MTIRKENEWVSSSLCFYRRRLLIHNVHNALGGGILALKNNVPFQTGQIYKNVCRMKYRYNYELRVEL
jgi:hypothetical protein